MNNAIKNLLDLLLFLVKIPLWIISRIIFAFFGFWIFLAIAIFCLCIYFGGFDFIKSTFGLYQTTEKVSTVLAKKDELKAKFVEGFKDSAEYSAIVNGKLKELNISKIVSSSVVKKDDEFIIYKVVSDTKQIIIKINRQTKAIDSFLVK